MNVVTLQLSNKQNFTNKPLDLYTQARKGDIIYNIAINIQTHCRIAMINRNTVLHV